MHINARHWLCRVVHGTDTNLHLRRLLVSSTASSQHIRRGSTALPQEAQAFPHGLDCLFNRWILYPSVAQYLQSEDGIKKVTKSEAARRFRKGIYQFIFYNLLRQSLRRRKSSDELFSRTSPMPSVHQYQRGESRAFRDDFFYFMHSRVRRNGKVSNSWRKNHHHYV